MKKTSSIFIILTFLCIFAAAQGGREWNYQRVASLSGGQLGIGNTAIGMRSDYTWPIVATNGGTAAMVPGGWVESSTGIAGYINAATSHDGQHTAFVGSSGQVKTFGPSGWSNSFLSGDIWIPEARNSVAYTQQDNVAVLYNSVQSGQLTLSVQQQTGGWSTNSLGQQYAEGYALAYDSYDQANVVFSQNGTLVYGTKGVLTNNNWNFSEPIPQPLGIWGGVDLELTSNDIPYIAYSDGSMLNYTTYDRIHGQWQSRTIDALGGGYSNFTMASDLQGGIGIAYVTDAYGMTQLGFAHMDGSGLWETELLPTDIFDELGNPMDFLEIWGDEGIGLAFDGDNNPVISFSNRGETWIAYDPMIVPEPTTCLLLLGGTVLFRCRKKD